MVTKLKSLGLQTLVLAALLVVGVGCQSGGDTADAPAGEEEEFVEEEFEEEATAEGAATEDAGGSEDVAANPDAADSAVEEIPEVDLATATELPPETEQLILDELELEPEQQALLDEKGGGEYLLTLMKDYCGRLTDGEDKNALIEEYAERETADLDLAIIGIGEAIACAEE